MSAAAVEQIRVFSDARGQVYEPLAGEILSGQRNAHVALTEPGCVRGNHHHQRGVETTVVAGPALVRCRENGALKDFEVPAGAVFRFVFPPGVTHAIKNTGARPSAIVSFSTVSHDPSNTIPDVVMPA